MFKPQGESLQKVAAHDIGSSVLGLFTDLKANGGSFTPFCELGLRSSFAIQSSVKVGCGEKVCFGSLDTICDVWERVEWRCWYLQGFMASCTLLQSFLPNHNFRTHINTSHVLIDFHVEFPREHLQVFFVVHK